MITLQPPADPITIDIVDGVSMTSRPVTFLDISIARAAADAVMDDLDNSRDVFVSLGLPVDAEKINLDDPATRKGLHQVVFVSELAATALQSWQGFSDMYNNDAPLDCTPENIRIILRTHFVLADAYWQGMLKWHMEFLRAKKESATGAAGTQPQAPVAHTATAAPKTTCPAPGENPAQTASAALMSKAPPKAGKSCKP